MFSLSDSIQISSYNTPLDVRTRVADLSKLTDGSIQMPYVGLIVWVTNEEKAYVVTGITGNQVTSYLILNSEDCFNYTSSTTYTDLSNNTKPVRKDGYVVEVDHDTSTSPYKYILQYIDGLGIHHKITVSQNGGANTDIPNTIAEVYVYNGNYQGLYQAVQEGKVIIWNNNVATVEYLNNAFRLSVIDGDGALHTLIISAGNLQLPTEDTKHFLKKEDYFYFDNSTTFLLLKNRGQIPVKIDEHVAKVTDLGTSIKMEYLDGPMLTTVIKSSDESVSRSQVNILLSVEVDPSEHSFDIKNALDTSVGSINFGSNPTTGIAELTFTDGTNTFSAPLPSIRYDSNTQLLKYTTDGGESWQDIIKMSNLQIKEVAASTSALQLTPTLGDLVLIGDNTNGYKLNVFDGTDWQPIGSINNVSLVADQIHLNSSKLIATNVKGGLEELSDKVENVKVTTWSGYVGASNATTISGLNLNNLTHYSNASGSVRVQISSTSYLWFAVNREVRIESFGIEVPVLYIGMDNGLYYYKTYEQILPSMIGIELIATDASQSDDSGGGDTPTPTPTAQKPTIVTPPQSATYTEGATPNALVVVASVSDGGTLSFQWYKDNSSFGSADSGTAVSNGVKSSITPTSETATYYCVITNSKSGVNSNTNQTTPVTITFNEESGSEETDLSDFVEGYWNASGQKIEDSNYLSSPLIDVSTDKNFVVFNDISKTGKTTSPTQVLSLWTGENTCRSAWEDSDKGRAGSAASGDTYMRFVFPNDAARADYCFIKIGNNYPFKGSKIKDDFLRKIYAFGKKMSNYGVTKGSDFNMVTNVGISLTDDRSFTFVAGPFDLQSGHTYTFETGRTTNGTSELDTITYVDDNNKFVARQYAKVSSFPNKGVPTIPSGATKFYLTCVFKYMHNCYLKDNGVYVWYGANIEI